MRFWAQTAVLILFLDTGAFGAGNTAAPQGTEPAPPPPKAAPAKPAPAKAKEKPKAPPEKKGADPSDNGGPAKGAEANVKQCARGVLVTIDPISETMEVKNAEKTSVLRFTEETILRIGEKRFHLTEPSGYHYSPRIEHLTVRKPLLEAGTKVILYCAPEGPQDVATLVRVQSE